jgi:hypothetical protein
VKDNGDAEYISQTAVPITLPPASKTRETTEASSGDIGYSDIFDTSCGKVPMTVGSPPTEMLSLKATVRPFNKEEAEFSAVKSHR